MESIKLCEYGCNEKANFQLKNGEWCCCQNCYSCNSYNICKAVREKNSKGLKVAHERGTNFYTFSNEAREREV